MKRIFGRPAAHGSGAGRALTDDPIRRAQLAGYRRMYLETSRRQTAATERYQRSGFVPTAPYYEFPAEMQD